MRSRSHRSALVRQLAGYLPAPAEAPRRDLAERLAEWLDVRDAIALHATHQALPSAAAPRQPTGRSHAAQLRAGLQGLRATLEQGIATPPRQPIGADDSHFGAIHQRCLDQQRRMDTAIGAFRAHVRQALAATSPRLAQLAALDATLDQLIGGREQRLLSGVPAFLKARFEQLRQTPSDAWPEVFEQELRQALLAELDLRLQPVTGMIEALGPSHASPSIDTP
ncbi:MAG: DUF3348 domain-containing protein [Comamonadaceae bacterium]|uniref:DUF3348 family protein n=1 Tax=Hydrogenophaga TaxID=47420 RepID=UPI0015F2A39B|nr:MULTISPECIES: DUF3348 family protein [Hydrogenophaga]NCT98669.1 DUF3348 domain-containing protein [Comamonadaceae bacterium]WQB83412.1 DUF3348 family protein [Hydrogenophaga sp. SNF1]